MTEENKTETDKTESALSVAEWRQKMCEAYAMRRAKEAAEDEKKKTLEKQASRERAQKEAEKGAKLLTELGLVVDEHFTEENEYDNSYAVCSVGDYRFRVYEAENGKVMKAVICKASHPFICSNPLTLPQHPGDNVGDANIFIWQKMNWLDEKSAEAAEKDKAEAERARVKAEQDAAYEETLRNAAVTPVAIPEFGGAFEAERVKNAAAGIARYASSCDALPLAWGGEMRKRLNATLIDMVADFGAWAVRERAERALQDAAQDKQDKEGSEIK